MMQRNYFLFCSQTKVFTLFVSYTSIFTRQAINTLSACCRCVKKPRYYCEAVSVYPRTTLFSLAEGLCLA